MLLLIHVPDRLTKSGWDQIETLLIRRVDRLDPQIPGDQEKPVLGLDFSKTVAITTPIPVAIPRVVTIAGGIGCIGANPGLRLVLEYHMGPVPLRFFDTLPEPAEREEHLPASHSAGPLSQLWSADVPHRPNPPLRLIVDYHRKKRRLFLEYREKQYGFPAVSVTPSDGESSVGAYFFLNVTSAPLSAQLLEEQVGDLLPPRVSRSSIHLDWEPFPNASITVRVLRRAQVDCQFTIWVELGQWNNPWTPEDYRLEFAREIRQRSALGIEVYLPEGDPGEIWLAETDVNPSQPLRTFIDRWRGHIHESHAAAEQALASRLHNESLVTHFRFPPEIRTAAEQYLLYFVQFLRDLGVEAEAELKHRAGEVLFSVTPTDGPAALARIESALRLYLEIPGRPEFDASMGGAPEPWMQSLAANVFFLKGQLATQAALLQMKDATIDHLESAVHEMRERQVAVGRLRSGEILRDALIEIRAGAEDKDCEPLVGKHISVIAWEKGPLRVHWPNLLREFKRRMGAGEPLEGGDWF